MSVVTEQDKADFRVGLVSFSALFILILGITFAGGEKGLLFQKSESLIAWLTDVGGLKKGGTVTMGGMAIGTVTGINFVDGQEKPLIEVKMQVRSDFRARIKSDSIPAVRTQGMLGDRYMEISMGTKGSEPLAPGKPLVGKSATDFDDTLREAQQTLNQTTKMLTAVNEQQGTIGQLLYDGKFYERLTTASEEVNELLKDFKKNPRRYIKFSLF